MEHQKPDRIREVNKLGQSIWVDMLHRELIASGEAAQLVEKGVSGFTTNPTSLETGISKTDAYDEALSRYKGSENPETVFEELIVEDIQDAADILRLPHEISGGRDGFVSVEVRPAFAHDAEGTIEDARYWLKLINRPNVMVKVPGTPEGVPAIRRLTSLGVNVNVTLLFSIDAYRDAANAYIDGLRDFIRSGSGTPQNINSVASFFVSRVDALVDDLITRKVEDTSALEIQALKGKIGIANARLAYEEFREMFSTTDFVNSESLGARKQRPLWASTSVKDPSYPETMYVDGLIGPDTVDTMPLETLRAFLERGSVAETLTEDVGMAQNHIQELESAGIMMSEVTDQLLEEGIKKFTDSYDNALKIIEEKLSKVAAS